MVHNCNYTAQHNKVQNSVAQHLPWYSCGHRAKWCLPWGGWGWWWCGSSSHGSIGSDQWSHVPLPTIQRSPRQDWPSCAARTCPWQSPAQQQPDTPTKISYSARQITSIPHFCRMVKYKYTFYQTCINTSKLYDEGSSIVSFNTINEDERGK